MRINEDLEKHFQPTVQKVAEMVRRQYGCAFSYRALDEIIREDSSLDARLSTGLPVANNRNKWVDLPVFLNDTLVGAGRISPADKFSNTQVLQLHQMIRLILEEALRGAEKIHSLEILENTTIENAQPTNVISLRKHLPNAFPLPDKKANNSLAFPFLIEGPSPDEIFKMALEIHHHSSRYAFLSIEDIAASAFESIQSLCALGAVTIYISDLTKVPLATQSQILNYYNGERDKESPQFIAGTQTSILELSKHAGVLEGLLTVLRVGYLYMQQPFSFYKKQNILEFFYDSLTGRTSV